MILYETKPRSEQFIILLATCRSVCARVCVCVLEFAKLRQAIEHAHIHLYITDNFGSSMELASEFMLSEV